MKIFIGFLVFCCFVFLAILGIQAVLAGLGAAITMVFGPARLRSLPRSVREDGALHLLAILAVALIAISLSAAAAFTAKPQVAMLISFTAWIAVGVMPLIAAFHLVCLEPEPKTHKYPRARQIEYFPKQLPKAS